MRQVMDQMFQLTLPFCGGFFVGALVMLAALFFFSFFYYRTRDDGSEYASTDDDGMLPCQRADEVSAQDKNPR